LGDLGIDGRIQWVFQNKDRIMTRKPKVAEDLNGQEKEMEDTSYLNMWKWKGDRITN
jgi:hypothetical protein